MPSIQFLSTTIVETWAGTDITTTGPIYPLVGSEVIPLLLGLLFLLVCPSRPPGMEHQEVRSP